jgi:hypothetical protein
MRTVAVVALGVFSLAGSTLGVRLAVAQDGTIRPDSSNVAAVGTAPVSSSSSADSPVATSPVVIPNANATSVHPFSSVGVGATLSTLGIGVEAATPLSQRTNLRAVMNLFSYSTTFNDDGINYAATLQLRSFDALLDWFPFNGSFHVSPGAMVYNGNQLKGSTSVAAGEYFTLNDVNYLSSPGTPVGGTASGKFSPAAPMVLAGWGNVASRSKHISIPVEAGAVFSGAPHTVLNLTGDVCNLDGTNCRAISSDPTVQSNILAQQTKFNNKVSPYKVLPVLSVGFAYRFSIGSRANY